MLDMDEYSLLSAEKEMLNSMKDVKAIILTALTRALPGDNIYFKDCVINVETLRRKNKLLNKILKLCGEFR